MKANELMIGDWVIFGDEPLKVQHIYNNGYDDIVAEIVEDGTNEYGVYEEIKDVPVVYCSPIPLTPEILEKNGFERSVVIPSNFYRNIDNERLIFSPHSSCYGLGYVHWDESNDADIMHRLEVQQPIMYIHQMQHALRLFGLDQLADNFKL